MSVFFKRPRRRSVPASSLLASSAPAASQESPFADGQWHSPIPRQQPGRMVPHPGPLGADGVLIVCAGCAAGQDWLLMCRDSQVTVRCRCGHEWTEAALDTAWFDAHCGPAIGPYGPREAGIRSFGFDGILAGTYLPN